MAVERPLIDPEHDQKLTPGILLRPHGAHVPDREPHLWRTEI